VTEPLGHRDAFMEGLRDALPVLLAVIPFGLVVGVAATDAGLPIPPAIGMSYIVYAGASQLAALQLLVAGSPVAVILLTTLLLNLRLMLYSASFSRHLAGAPWLLRLWMASIMTDQSMALGSQRFGRYPARGGRVAYYLGSAFPVWVVWTTASTVGVLLGATVPSGLSLEFAVPLVFLTLWVLAMLRGSRAVWIAGVVAASVAVLAKGLPFNLGLVVAAFTGIGAGLYWELRHPPAPRPGRPPDQGDR
jgi:predicted branched-subunit amino acid permease